MSTRHFFTATALVAAGMLSVTGCVQADPKPVSSGTDSPATGAAFMIECTPDNLVQEPKTFTLSCGDGNQNLEGLRWRNWGAKQATAVGVATTNLCIPDCATGKVTGQDVKVIASGLVTGEAAATYTSLRVIAVNEHAEGTIEDETFKLPGVTNPGDLSGN